MSVNRCERCPGITCESDDDARTVMLPDDGQEWIPVTIEQCSRRDDYVPVERSIQLLNLLGKPHLAEKLLAESE